MLLITTSELSDINDLEVEEEVLQYVELKSESRFDECMREIIVTEIARISVRFYFWKDYDTEFWSYISLIGNDKEKVLHRFNFEVVFNKE
ncbi:3728_t:CDS:2 [Scutellospora calospora]|uniref:3728_t:CDS:1 n=1 Tax=Scutellospora calospora TaxID=85575 RepID=A0ACA9L6F4_9GLOM|nr:3728_t:CDS:2 [Scutellospora calospora]